MDKYLSVTLLVWICLLSNQTVVGASLRVIGGFEATKNSIPYQAALILDGESFCGGAIISPKYVLTAAHCMYKTRYVYVVLGAHNFRSNEPTQQVFKSTAFIIHAGFKSTDINFDISLLKVSFFITFNANVKPIKMADSNSGNFAGQLAMLSGWGGTSKNYKGISSNLRNVYLTVTTNSMCQLNYRSTPIRSTHLCTDGFDIFRGIVGGCYGDSGSPLVHNNELIGILSFGGSDCVSGVPSVYSRISEYRDWIRRYSGI